MSALTYQLQFSQREAYLPLSWTATDTQKIFWQSRPLPISGWEWRVFGEVPSDYDLSRFCADLFQGPDKFILRGCPEVLVKNGLEHGGSALCYGAEAVLDLAHEKHLSRKSIQSLVRRGLRHGQITELNSTAALASDQLFQFVQAIQDQYSAPLQHLYRMQLEQSQRWFVFESSQGILGCLSLIAQDRKTWQIELLLRNPTAPVGIMEALIDHVFCLLKAEDALVLSLGEVPFEVPFQITAPQAQWITKIGQGINFAYSSAGLAQFKAKFTPIWRPVYLYGYPKIRWASLLEMFFYSNCHRLIVNTLKERLRGLT